MKKNYPIYIAIVTLILINIIFLWNEPFYFFCKEPFYRSLPFDAAKFSTVVSIVGVVLNSLTIYLLYKQIEEMALARREAYKPAIYPSNSHFEFSYDEPIITVFKNAHHPIFNRILLNKKEEGSHDVELHNIGLGTAKEVKAIWKIDLVKIREFLKENKSYYSCSDLFEGTDESIELITNITFIPNNQIYLLDIPQYLMVLFGEKNKENIINLIENSKMFDDIASLALEYKDISNHQYSALYKVSFELINLGNNDYFSYEMKFST